ncbi:hypothetical protein FEM03_19050 [Phragmitibacter flavus]|uniref:CN hydrolase domain-containing protein n=1 Tax=Phragmitibacter flavus TaxID=2576071 RepID=A0A5R8KC91_9BACT|nr:nitrilase-related carbon-nitrogen hydrolase [Phragmitibacter flavus]TLD69199.1 hypothetical protein FEM03_19050 [Phragmitibacter flavus]
MAELTVDLMTCDVGAEAASPEAFADFLVSRTTDAWDGGADVVLFPEFSWLGLERFVEGGPGALQAVGKLFWEELWPGMSSKLTRSDKAVVLGTVPFVGTDGMLRNRAPVVVGDHVGYQDKLNLTPWESAFSPGEGVQLFSLGGVRFAVIICLDIEIPELSVALRGKGVDLILVPSATESVLGVERVGRCASARAVELGCYVGVSHLVGRAKSELVDENVGRLAWLTPSQVPFEKDERESGSAIFESGFEVNRVVVDGAKLARMRRRRAETNPSLLSVDLPRVMDENL